MKREIQFTKMSGAGNDFIVINNMNGSLPGNKAKLASALCSRHFGIGADGLLLLEQSTTAGFFMRYYNADGSYGGMCGNGGRCIARFAFTAGLAKQTMTFEALDYVYTAEVDGPTVRLQMKSPRDLRTDVLVATGDRTMRGSFVDTGSPHFVVDVTTLSSVDVQGLGKRIRHHELFDPHGANVNFIELINSRELSLRTYERGVEAETLACGTGSVAAAIIGSVLHGMQSPVKVHVRSGEELQVYFDRHGNKFDNVVLEGSAHFLFSGKLLYDHENNRILDTLQLPAYLP